MLVKSILLFMMSFIYMFCNEAEVHPKQRNAYFHECKFHAPEAFEKIYVNAGSVLSMPDGIYLKHENGEIEKVRMLSHDCQGAYVMRIHTVCPQCGRIYIGQTSPEGWNCLSHEIQIKPSIWIKP